MCSLLLSNSPLSRLAGAYVVAEPLNQPRLPSYLRALKHFFVGTTALCAAMVVTHPALAQSPTGGNVVAGAAGISQLGNITNINQSSQRAIINWQGFSVGAQNTVNFYQPGASSVTLNRVIGNETSVINGAINANGQVFIVNSAGVLFGKGSQINVGGLVASTLDIANNDFMAGNYKFSGNSASSIVNQGRISAHGGGQGGGYVALMGRTVSNEGVIAAKLGTVAMASGDKMTLNFGGDSLVDVTIDQGTLNALVANKRAIIADGGTVILTAKAADQVLSAQVNNSGVIQARSMSALKGGSNGSSSRGTVKLGKIKLVADGGTVNVSGKLDASAPKGGDGGFIETSGDQVKIADSALITTKAAYGNSGSWLIDPTNFTIAAGTGAQTASGIGATTLQNNLSTNGSVTIATSTATNGSDLGDINVNAAVTVPTNTSLTLIAAHDVNVSAGLTLTAGATTSLTLSAANNINVNSTIVWTSGTVTLNAGANIFVNATMQATGTGNFTANYGHVINPDGSASTTVTGTGFNADGVTPYRLYSVQNVLPGGSTAGQIRFSGSGTVTLNGQVYTVITTAAGLDAVAGNMSGNYVLGADISNTLTAPVGLPELSLFGFSTPFTGNFNGFGHTVSTASLSSLSLPSSINAFNTLLVMNYANDISINTNLNLASGVLTLSSAGAINVNAALAMPVDGSALKLSAAAGITINSALNWSSNSVLVLSAVNNTNTANNININAPVTWSSGTLLALFGHDLNINPNGSLNGPTLALYPNSSLSTDLMNLNINAPNSFNVTTVMAGAVPYFGIWGNVNFNQPQNWVTPPDLTGLRVAGNVNVNAALTWTTGTLTLTTGNFSASCCTTSEKININAVLTGPSLVLNTANTNNLASVEIVNVTVANALNVGSISGSIPGGLNIAAAQNWTTPPTFSITGPINVNAALTWSTGSLTLTTLPYLSLVTNINLNAVINGNSVVLNANGAVNVNVANALNVGSIGGTDGSFTISAAQTWTTPPTFSMTTGAITLNAPISWSTGTLALATTNLTIGAAQNWGVAPTLSVSGNIVLNAPISWSTGTLTLAGVNLTIGAAQTWLAAPVVSMSGDIVLNSPLSWSTGTLTLLGTNITLNAAQTWSRAPTLAASGNINVNAAQSWSSGTLTLNAGKDMYLNAVMTANGTANLAASYGRVLDASGNPTTTATAGSNSDGTPYGLYTLIGPTGSYNGRIDFSGTGGVTLNGQAYTIITSVTGLDAIAGNLSGKYVLANDVTGVSLADLLPFGFSTATPFTGNFNGFGHTLTTVSLPSLTLPASIATLNTGLVLNSAGDISIGANMNLGAGLLALNAAAINVNSAVTWSSNASLKLNAGAGDITIAAPLSGSTLVLNTTGSVNVNAANALNVTTVVGTVGNFNINQSQTWTSPPNMAGLAANGDINVNASLGWTSSSGTLTLNAGNNINVKAPITWVMGGTLTLNAANQNINISGSGLLSGGAAVLNAANGTFEVDVADALKFSSVSGTVKTFTITQAQHWTGTTPNLSALTVNSDININASLTWASGIMRLTSVAGDIKINGLLSGPTLTLTTSSPTNKVIVNVADALKSVSTFSGRVGYLNFEAAQTWTATPTNLSLTVTNDLNVDAPLTWSSGTLTLRGINVNIGAQLSGPNLTITTTGTTGTVNVNAVNALKIATALNATASGGFNIAAAQTWTTPPTTFSVAGPLNVNAPLTWSAGTLKLAVTGTGSNINLNAPITGTDSSGNALPLVLNASGAVNVNVVNAFSVASITGTDVSGFNIAAAQAWTTPPTFSITGPLNVNAPLTWSTGPLTLAVTGTGSNINLNAPITDTDSSGNALPLVLNASGAVNVNAVNALQNVETISGTDGGGFTFAAAQTWSTAPSVSIIGDINVNAPLSWSTGTLTLAATNVNFNAAQIWPAPPVLNVAQAVNINAPLSISTGTLTILTTNINLNSTITWAAPPVLTAFGNITVNAPQSWSTGTLTLNAGKDIFINSVMTASGTANLVASYGRVLDASGNPTGTATAGTNADGTPFGLYMGVDSTANYTGRIDFSGAGAVTLNGQTYTVITSLAGLDAVAGNLSGNYVLGKDVASVSLRDLLPFGFATTNQFAGKFNGFGHALTTASLSSITLPSSIAALSDTKLVLNSTGDISINTNVTSGVGILALNATGAINLNASLQSVGGSFILGAAAMPLGATATVSGATIVVNAPVTWSSNDALTFNAYNNLTINGAINNATGNTAALTLNGTTGSIYINNAIALLGTNAALTMNYAGDYVLRTVASYSGVVPATTTGTTPSSPAPGGTDAVGVADQAPAGTVYASITLSGANAGLTINGSTYHVIHNVSDLIAANGVAGNYALADNLSLSGTTYSDAVVKTFTGTFAGLGHTIDGMTIVTNASNIGLFGTATVNSVIRDIGVTNINILTQHDPSTHKQNNTGGLVGLNDANISQAYATGIIKTVSSASDPSGGLSMGGLIGYNQGTKSPNGNTIADSFANVKMDTIAGETIGGLIGQTGSVSIFRSHANGDVLGDSSSGGLIGVAGGSYVGIFDSYATGAVSTYVQLTTGDIVPDSSNTGGLVGSFNPTQGYIINSFATGQVTGGYNVGGLIGQMGGNITLDRVYATGAVASNNYSNNINALPGDDARTGIGGLVGMASSGTINITNSHATGDVNGGIYSGGTGGLVGYAMATLNVDHSYASGNVSSETTNTTIGNAILGGVGGLVGGMETAGSITNSGATGSVNGLFRTGALVGEMNGTLSNSYYNVDANPGLSATGYSGSTAPGATGLTGSQSADLKYYLNGTINRVLAERAAAAQAAAERQATIQQGTSTANAITNDTQTSSITSPDPTMSKAGASATQTAKSEAVEDELNAVDDNAKADDERKKHERQRTAQTNRGSNAGGGAGGLGATIRSIDVDGQRFNLQDDDKSKNDDKSKSGAPEEKPH